MSPLTRFRIFLWMFGRFKVPVIGYLRPKLLVIDDREVVVRIPLRRRAKNHLHSMYFGTLAVGADIAGGLHGLWHARAFRRNISLVFKSFEAQFLSRPESDVCFISNDGEIVRTMIAASAQTGERINRKVSVDGFVNYPENPTLVAQFVLELSIKVL